MRDLLSPSLLVRNCSAPFLHTQLSDIFAPYVIARITRDFPNEEDMTEARKRSRRGRRCHFWITNGSVANYLKTSSIWPMLLRANFQESLRRFLIDRTYLRFTTAGDVRFTYRYVREELPYFLPPHLDMESKAGVLIVYLEAEGVDLGTSLYAQKASGFREAKRVDFVQNHGILIPRMADSWHGGEWRYSGYRKTLHIYVNHA